MARIGFLFKDARRTRLCSGMPFPTDLFYGYFELRRQTGATVDLLEQSDLGVGLREGPVWKLANRFVDGLVGLHARALWQLSRRTARRRLDDYDAIFVTQNSLGFCLALLHRIGFIRPTLYFIIMGGLDDDVGGMRRYGRMWGLASVRLLSLSRSESAFLARRYGQVVHYLPFGTDIDFWCPDPTDRPGDNPDNERYILAVGNDPNRDYATLISAWRPDFPRLKIVTRLEVGPLPANVEVMRGHYGESTITDADIRTLYRGALFVVLPLRNTTQPAGQSVALQAMACGRTVVMSRIDGLWDGDALSDGQTCVLVPPGDPVAMGDAITHLCNEPSRTAAIAKAGRTMVLERFAIRRTADALVRLLAQDGLLVEGLLA